MATCCGTQSTQQNGDSTTALPAGSMGRFARMIPNCLEYAQQAKAAGRPIVGMLCEFTPRELIMAAGDTAGNGAGAVPVCLCGGSHKTALLAEQELPANLCPLIKSTFGYHLSKANPFLEMADLIVAETTCDGKKKMYELLAQTHPLYVLELPQKVDEPAAAQRWYEELQKLKVELERRFPSPISDDRLRQAIVLMNRERSLRRRLAELMKSDAPPLTGRQLLELKSSISGIACDLEAYEQIASTLRGASRPGNRDRVRVLLTGVPVAHGAERVVDIIENAGGLIVAMENCTGLKPILDDVDEAAPDPLAAIATKYLHLPCSVMTPNRRRLDLLSRLASEYRAACVIDLVWQACITYDVESRRVQTLVSDTLGLPYLRIETDYSPSDTARLQTRIEATLETARARAGKGNH